MLYYGKQKTARSKAIEGAEKGSHRLAEKKPAAKSAAKQTAAKTAPKSAAKAKKPKKKKKGSTLLFVMLVLLLLLLLLIFGGLYAVSMYYYNVYQSTAPINYADVAPDQFVTNIYDYQGNLIDSLHGEENREYAALTEMPKTLQNAVIAIEDQRFYEHTGVDVEGILRAIYVNLKEQQFLEGASTITQQLVKNNLLEDNSVRLQRKIEEQCVAYKLEADLRNKLGSARAAKNYILEQYLNTVNFAHGLNGVKMAAKFYFGKELSELTLTESASLAAIIKNPTRYSPKNSPEENWSRTQTVLRRMLEQQLITYNDYVVALEQDIYTNNEHILEDQDAVIHSYFVDKVINDVARDLMYERGYDQVTAYKMVYSGGLSIYTTYDPQIQQIVDEAFRDDSLFPRGTSFNVDIAFETNQGVVHKNANVASDEGADAFIIQQRQALTDAGYTIENESIQKVRQPQGAFAIIDYRTGHVPAMGAGRGEKQYNMAFNRATQAKRQPGSCFKVLAAYLPALQMGYLKADSVIEDAPYTVGGYSPNNYDFRYRGNISLRTAIKDSINVAAVKTLVQVGYQNAFDYLKRLGFTTLVEERTDANGKVYTDLGPALALGGLTDGVTPVELAAAYGTIANGGKYNRPVFYTKVLGHDGAILLDNVPQEEKVIDIDVAYLLTDLMTDVIKNGTGTQARFWNIGVPIAGKTGTSTDDKDLSFAGYTPYYVAAVWQGYDTPKELNYSTNYHLLLWRRIMEQVHVLKGFTSGSFEMPQGMTQEMLGRSVNTSNPLPENVQPTPAEPQQNQQQPAQTPDRPELQQQMEEIIGGNAQQTDDGAEVQEAANEGEAAENSGEAEDASGGDADGTSGTDSGGDSAAPNPPEPAAPEQTAPQSEPPQAPEPPESAPSIYEKEN